MKALYSLLSLIGLSIVMISCQTEVDDDLPAPPAPPGTSDSTYLSEWIILDTTYSSGVDTSDKYRLFYDANKRLSKFVYESYNLGLSGAARLYMHSECSFTYKGADTVPSHTLDIYSYTNDPTRIIHDTIYYFYKNGMIRKDSLLVPNSGDDYLANELTYLGGDRYRIRSMRYSINQMYVDDTGYSHVNWQSDLLLSSHDSSRHDPYPWYSSSVQISYDNKPNPFKRLLLPYPAPMSGFIFFENRLHDWGFLPTRNNVTRYEKPGQPAVTYTYEYRANGLPSVCRLAGTNNFYAKMVFKYTRP